MQLRINEEAVNDIAGLREYIAVDNEQAAILITNKILNYIEGLSQFYESRMKLENRTKRRNKYRFGVVAPYLIFYKIEKDTVRVYRVLHASTDYLKLLNLNG